MKQLWLNQILQEITGSSQATKTPREWYKQKSRQAHFNEQTSATSTLRQLDNAAEQVFTQKSCMEGNKRKDYL